MPPKLDPYATPRARAVDLALIIFTLLLIALAIWTAPRHRSDTGAVGAQGRERVSAACLRYAPLNIPHLEELSFAKTND